MSELVTTLTSVPFLATFCSAIAVFATVLSVMRPILARDQMNQRMRVMALERDKLRSKRMSDLNTRDAQRSGKLRQSNGGFMQRIVDKLDLRRQFDNEELRNKLKMAGLRGERPIVAFMFFRVAAPPLSLLGALVYLFVLSDLGYTTNTKLLISVAVGAAGYYLPNLFIENLAQKRQESIKQSFPDALDMLLICVQAGMSVESAFGKVSKEISAQSLELGEEFSLTTAELSYLPERRQAFENLGKRTGLVGVKAVTTALIQAERYGTPVSQALRTMAKENREIRMGDAEKKAAALPPKLTVPMILFFLPVLFLVILGPAAIGYWKLH
ncbi:MAG: type II secretion system F family protein [Hyphomicrobium sp.]